MYIRSFFYSLFNCVNVVVVPVTFFVTTALFAAGCVISVGFDKLCKALGNVPRVRYVGPFYVASRII